jgi:HEPN domain-containing protein
MQEAAPPFPGELATPRQVFHLAESYRLATQLLEPQGRPGDPLSRAPYRLTAIQAIELYLNALLLQQGHDAKRIRGMQHDLGERTQLAITGGLKLRDRTAKHLASMVSNREYLITRYEPEITSTVSQINRLTATLNEVAAKVSAVLEVR